MNRFLSGTARPITTTIVTRSHYSKHGVTRSTNAHLNATAACTRAFHVITTPTPVKTHTIQRATNNRWNFSQSSTTLSSSTLAFRSFASHRFMSSSSPSSSTSSSTSALPPSSTAATGSGSSVDPTILNNAALDKGISSHVEALSDAWYTFFPQKLQELMITIHSHMPVEATELTGLTPWVATIVATTLLFRLCLFPMAIQAQRNVVATARARPEMEEVQKKFDAIVEKYKAAGWALPMEEINRYRSERKAVNAKYGAHQGKAFGMLMVQMPIFITMFAGLRTLGYADPSFLEGGMAWFTNLGGLDTGFHDWCLKLGPMRFAIGLPLINSALIIMTVKLNTDLQVETGGKFGETMKKVMYFFGIIAWPFCSSGVPTGVLIYWATSNIYSFLQAKLLRSSYGRKLFNIPEMPKNAQNFDKMFSQLSEKFGLNKAKPAANIDQAINPFEPIKPTTTHMTQGTIAQNNQPRSAAAFYQKKAR